VPTVELTELVEPSHTALLLQEVQEGVIGATAALRDLAEAATTIGLAGQVANLASAARIVGVHVVHCTAARLPAKFGSNHNARLFAAADRLGALAEAGDPSVAPLDGLLDRGDIVLPRFHGLSPMCGTQLDSLLRNAGVRTVVVVGVSLNVAIPNLAFDAINRSYQVVVVEDAVAGVPLDYGQQVLRHTLRSLVSLTTASQLIDIWRA
jgi:biuret amidohydrolase